MIRTVASIVELVICIGLVIYLLIWDRRQKALRRDLESILERVKRFLSPSPLDNIYSGDISPPCKFTFLRKLAIQIYSVRLSCPNNPSIVTELEGILMYLINLYAISIEQKKQLKWIIKNGLD